LLKNNVVHSDSIIVERVKAAGALVVGKTNVPEFAMGSHTFNPIFGVTPNAYDPSRAAGGSSGGAAVALAHRLLPVADGSDLMGSLRNPAAWNNVFGMRPSQGLVPFAPGPDVWLSQLGTEGPMARNVADLARLLHTQAGYDPRQPLGLESHLSEAVEPQDLRGLQVGWLGDLGGYLATEAGVLPACEAGLDRLRGAGAEVRTVTLDLDLDAVWQSWLAWRRALVGPRVGALMTMPGAREAIKPESLWEYDQSVVMDLSSFMRASETRTRLYNRMVGLLHEVDVLALPVAQTWPIPVEQRWPGAIAGRTMDTYHRWMETTIYATLAGLPAISVPSGFDTSGRWPMGLQLIGQPRGDRGLLSIAAAYEACIGDWLAVRPALPDLARAPTPLPL
jgi:amidase